MREEFTPELALELDKKEEYAREVYRKAAKLGFTSIKFPKESSRVLRLGG